LRGFCKHLLINWQWGEAILPKNYWIMKWQCGQLQWAAGTGCDAAISGFSTRNSTEKI
jgi:deoxyribodipyrimidine photolyase